MILICLVVPWGCLRFVIVVFPDHTHLLFLVPPPGFFLTHLFSFTPCLKLALNTDCIFVEISKKTNLGSHVTVDTFDYGRGHLGIGGKRPDTDCMQPVCYLEFPPLNTVTIFMWSS